MSSLWTIVLIVFVIAIILLIVGTIGYHCFLDEEWEDSAYLAALTMASLSLEVKPKTREAKLFIAVYTVISIGFYLILIAAIIAAFLEPTLHHAKMEDSWKLRKF